MRERATTGGRAHWTGVRILLLLVGVTLVLGPPLVLAVASL